MTLRIGIDIGGTFTDLVAIAEDGRVETFKTASTPSNYGDGIVAGIQALVERRLRLEVTEKTRPDGSISVPLDLATVAAAIDILKTEKAESVAICLLHSYVNPAHEQAVAAAIRAALPDVDISVSSEILPEIKEYPRTSTTAINAYVQPVVRAYIAALDARLRALGIDAPLKLMQSNGGLASATFAAAAPAHIVESGPAAGVVGAAALARRLNEPGLITFDMGGTTAKAGLVENGEVLRAEAIEIGGGVMAGSRLLVGAGYMLKLPAIDLAEVGAGGGSICRLDAAGAPKAGPQSAGADPGPVCYGRGGVSPTITDCNLLLGYLDPGGLVGGTLKLDRAAAEAAIARDLAGPMNCSVEDAAYGMLRLASATMMRAIRAVSVERGRDPRQFALLAFGGNGPLFAAGLAKELGIRRVIVPPLPGVFSAFGLLVADTEHHATQSFRQRLDAADPNRIASILSALAATGAERLAADGFPVARRAFRRAALARYLGQSSEIEVPLPDGAVSPADIAELFGRQHEMTYGFRAPAHEPVELMGLSVLARGEPDRPRLPANIPPRPDIVPASRRAWFPGDGWIETPVVNRASLAAAPRQGPFIVQEYDATCLVPRGATAAVDAFGNIAMTLN